jgi:uncharacterized protein (DUF488 family)
MQEAWERVEAIELGSTHDVAGSIWVGSIGYEGYKDNQDFARVLAEAGVRRLVDVRELPISRKRGFAKSALTAACSDVEIDYLHIREFGNPKPIRDLYKSGRVEQGRAEYEAFLLEEREDAVLELSELLTDAPTALMCVERDVTVCHRHVIFESLKTTGGLQLEIAEL